MSFRPIAPFGGIAGWNFIQRTRDTQQQALNQSPSMTRETDHFRERIGTVRTAEELVGDRRLLSVALGAFGLGEDIGNKYFIRRVLEDGTLDPEALANRLADKRYLALSKAFGFGDFDVPNTQLSDFADRIIAQFQERQFEIGVGESQEDLRLALGAVRDIDEVLGRDSTPDGYWFAVMGNPPLRRVFETALGLPSEISGLDLDRQLAEFRDRAQRRFGGAGEVADFADPDRRDRLINTFLARSSVEQVSSASAPGAGALFLLTVAAGQ